MGGMQLDILELLTVCNIDSNFHSPIWNPSCSRTHDQTAAILVNKMTEWGIPIFGLHNSHTVGTTFDLVWLNKQLGDLLISCNICSNNVANHTSAHQAMITPLLT